MKVKKTAAPKKTSTAAKKAAAARGSKIMTKAKEIRKNSPSKKWTTCVKEAGKSLKGKL